MMHKLKMPSESALWVVLSILSVLMLISIIVFFVINNEYNKLTSNSSKLCINGSCAYPSSKCGAVPFKVADDGTLLCNSPSSLDVATPTGVTNPYV
jgi:hypothetical protein